MAPFEGRVDRTHGNHDDVDGKIEKMWQVGGLLQARQWAPFESRVDRTHGNRDDVDGKIEADGASWWVVTSAQVVGITEVSWDFETGCPGTWG